MEPALIARCLCAGFFGVGLGLLVFNSGGSNPAVHEPAANMAASLGRVPIRTNNGHAFMGRKMGSLSAAPSSAPAFASGDIAGLSPENQGYGFQFNGRASEFNSEAEQKWPRQRVIDTLLTLQNRDHYLTDKVLDAARVLLDNSARKSWPRQRVINTLLELQNRDHYLNDKVLDAARVLLEVS